MGMHIEISGHPSTIVVTLSGSTDLVALQPLQPAVAAALAEGQTVLVDIDNLVDLDTGLFAQTIRSIDPPAARLKLVAARSDHRAAAARLTAELGIEIYPDLDAAMTAVQQPPAGPSEPDPQEIRREWSAKFAALGDQYLTAIHQCRKLIRDLHDEIAPPPSWTQTPGPTGPGRRRSPRDDQPAAP